MADQTAAPPAPRTTRRAILAAAGCGAACAAIGVGGTRWIDSLDRVAWGVDVATSFGTVTLLQVARLTLGAAGGTQAGSHGAAHDPLAPGKPPVPSRVHGAWTDAVAIDVEVRNRLPVTMALSPGQFRLRVDRTGPTVSLYDADRPAGTVAAHSTTALRIRYLAPGPEHGLTLDFEDVRDARTVRLGRLEHAHGGRR